MFEIIKKIREIYKIKDSYEAYEVDSKVWHMFNSKKDADILLSDITRNEEDNSKEPEIDQLWGMYKGTYFDIVAYDAVTGLDCSDIYYVVFTNNVQKFIDEYIKKLPPMGSIAQVGIWKPISVRMEYQFVKMGVGDNGVPILNDDMYSKLNKEIQSFLKNERMYKENKFEYKRGILLHGPPGNGKTSFIKSFVRDLDAMVIMVNNPDKELIEFLQRFLCDKRHDHILKVLVFEDVEGLDSYTRSAFLNLLDGITRLHKVIFLATTNFPDKLDIGIQQRPSRFDMLLEIGVPNDDSRKKLIKRFFYGIPDTLLQNAIKDTKGFSGAYFKEIYILHKLLNINIGEAIKELKKRFKLFGSDKE